MAGLQVAFRIFSKADPDPATLVAQLNVTLKENLPQSKFATLFLGRLDTESGVVEYANAGHPPPLWVRHDGVEELGETDLLLGVVSHAEYTNRRVQLAPGDALILFTDGVSEAENAEGQELGSEIVAMAVKTLHGSHADVLAHTVDKIVLAHVGEPDALGDDVTLVVVSRDS